MCGHDSFLFCVAVSRGTKARRANATIFSAAGPERTDFRYGLLGSGDRP
jgi:hypothetical protein